MIDVKFDAKISKRIKVSRQKMLWAAGRAIRYNLFTLRSYPFQ
jgi:hypothetical protein